MLVGDVRCASAGSGTSCRLSGGRWLSSAPTQRSKKRQLSRARPCRNTRSLSRSSSSGLLPRVRAAHQLVRGEPAQSVNRSTPSTGCSPHNEAIARPAHSSDTGACCRRNEGRSWRAAACACAAVVHSSRLRRLTTIRQSERRAASVSRRAWAASWLNCQAAAARALTNSPPPTWKKWPHAIRLRVGTRPASEPSNGPASSAPNTMTTALAGSSEPSNTERPSRTAQAGSTRERRRLSLIFQRPRRSTPKLRAFHITGSSCQSPRVQRCRRDAATPGCCGYSSTRVTSLTYPQRAMLPSSRSWLSTDSPGKRASRTAWQARTLSRPLPVKLPVPNRSWYTSETALL